MNSEIKKVDIVVSCYNEEKNIVPFYNETKKHLKNKKYVYNIIYVNDGSTDNTFDEILKVSKKSTSKVKISYISFIHNFGHEAAMCAGLNNAKGDVLIFLDVDLQHPPKKVPIILKKFENGTDCVLMKRVKYETNTLLKKFFSNAYYIFSKYVLQNKNYNNVSDYFAIDKNVAKIVNDKYNTSLRFLRSFVQNEAKNIKIVDFNAIKRKKGSSKYDYIKLLKLAVISELSRSKILREKYKATKEKPIYIIDKKKTKLR